MSNDGGGDVLEQVVGVGPSWFVGEEDGGDPSAVFEPERVDIEPAGRVEGGVWVVPIVGGWMFRRRLGHA